MLKFKRKFRRLKVKERLLQLKLLITGMWVTFDIFVYLLPPLCRLFTNIYLKQTKFIRYIPLALPLFRGYDLWWITCNCISHCKRFVLWQYYFPKYVGPIYLFSVVPWHRAFPLRCSGILWMILQWFQSPLLLFVTLLFK